MRWTCPRCDREFARARQSHVCVPGITVDATFEGRPPYMRAVYDEILAVLGPVHEDAVGVGVFLKVERKLAEVRPMATQLRLLLMLPRTVNDPRIARVWPMAEGGCWHDLRFKEPDRLGDKESAWLEEAYDFAGDPL